MTEPLTLTYISYALGVVTVVEQFLGYLPEGYPRSISQCIFMGSSMILSKIYPKKSNNDEIIVIV